MRRHTWTFVTAQASSDAPMLVTVCSSCGLTRTSLLPNTLSERHIGLGGDCPGEPQKQEPTGRGQKRTDIG